VSNNLPFTRWYNLNEETEIDVFAEQIRGYISYVYRGIQGEDPKTVLQNAWNNYGLRCQLFDFLVKSREIGRITNEEFKSEIKTGCRVLWLALRPDFRKAVVRLNYWHQYRRRIGTDWTLAGSKRGVGTLNDFLRRLAIVRTVEDNLRPMDDIGWFSAPQSKNVMLVYDPTKMTTILNNVRNPGRMLDFDFEATNKPRLTISQKEVLELLESFWEMKRNRIKVAGVAARTIPLILAASGTGKSFIVRHFAESNSLPLLCLDSASWIIAGAHAQPQTIATIKQHVARNPAGVIFIDELDKFTAQTDWSKNVQQEVYSLLDGGLRGFESFSPEEKAKLNERFLLVGVGTWQTLFDSGTKSMGFGSGSGSDFSIEQEVVKQAGIPHELLARFNANLIVLKPPTQGEFKDWISDIHKQLLIDPPASIDALSQSAVESGLSARWLEAYVSKLLLDRTRPKFGDGQVYLTDANNKDSDRLGHP